MESRIGGRSENQDMPGFADSELGVIVVVCDGMGGMQGGSTASSLAVKTIIDDVIASSEDPIGTLRRAILHANEVILETGDANPSLKGMGTTVTAVLLNEQKAYVAHVGDSRVYQLRGRRKIFRTFDDSAVFQFVRSGAISEEQARVSANSNVILKALGVTDELDFDIDVLPYDKGDRFVLCTDGFWGNVPEPVFLNLITKRGPIDLVVERTAGKMEKAGILEKGGGHDNLTAAVFDTKVNSKYRSKMEKRFKALSAVLAVLLLASIAANVMFLCKDKPQANTESTEVKDVIDNCDSLQQDMSAKGESAAKKLVDLKKKIKDATSSLK